MADRMFENRRVRRDATQAVIIDEFLEAALGHEPPGQKVEPNGLTMIRERLQRIHYQEFLAICDSAAAISLSATTPNFCTHWRRHAKSPWAKRPRRQPVPVNRGQFPALRALAACIAVHTA